ncbi:MAG: anion transporter [Clostridia bacterium]|nr:anion transporter [Clostridia bacterium]
MIKTIHRRLRGEIVFVAALSLAVITGFFAPTHLKSIDFGVIAALFNLMLLTLVFEKYHLLDYISISLLRKVSSERDISLVMIPATALLSMFITNDVALISVVPLTVGIGKKAGFDPYRIVVLEALAANIGSSLTPFGNPQNLFLFNSYGMSTGEFLSVTAPFSLSGIAILCIISLFLKKDRISSVPDSVPLGNKAELGFFIILFAVVLLSILRVIPVMIVTIIVIAVFLLSQRDLIGKADYFLLGTFVAFFIFIDHVVGMPAVVTLISGMLRTDAQVFAFSALGSQAISNVPSAVLFSGFTGSYKALLIGVSVGGVGTLVASLANLIAYRLYAKNYETWLFNRYFHITNFTLLALFLIAGIFIFI